MYTGEYHSLPESMAVKLREYAQEKKELLRAENRSKVMQGMSPILREDVR